MKLYECMTYFNLTAIRYTMLHGVFVYEHVDRRLREAERGEGRARSAKVSTAGTTITAIA